MTSVAAAFVQRSKKIVAIGRNYAAHAKELNNPTPKEPFFFLKPTTSYVPSGGRVEIPCGIIAHHEVELGLVIGKDGRDISQANATAHVAGYTLAVDMTARNLQDKVKKAGLPWSAAKGFDTFTPIGYVCLDLSFPYLGLGPAVLQVACATKPVECEIATQSNILLARPFIPKTTISDPHSLRLSLKINGVLKQDGMTSDMIFRIPRLIEHVSSIMTLEEGDLILTGTPEGVGQVVPGDKVECLLADENGKELATLNFTAAAREGGYEFQP
ncbi:hypothetical protein C0995_002623 [Termitomyces sp. Mi166|nr:hypothetical protein C0995_002623 [Termitomyces sp. Mi166\